MWTPSYDYLEHHGIEGQKWGRRNGPPYPLDYDDHSTSEKKKNPKLKLDNYDDKKRASKKKKESIGTKINNFTKNHKKELIIGGLVLTTAGIIAGKKFADSQLQNTPLSDYAVFIANQVRNGRMAGNETWVFGQERVFKNGARVEGHYVGNKEGYDKAVKDFAERSRRMQNMDYSTIAGLLPMKY